MERYFFNPYHVGECLELSDSAVRNYLAKMNEKQAVMLKNSDVRDKDIRKLNNAGEKFITESGVYKLVFKSRKPNAEAFTDWVTDEVLPTLRKTGSYEMPKQKQEKKKKNLSAANMLVKTVSGIFKDAGVDPMFIAAEAKRLYKEQADIDIQIPLSGTEIMGYTAAKDCIPADAPYNAEKDITFFEGLAETYITVKPGMFAIFFPQDGHAPGITPEGVKKVIVKVKA